MIVLLYKIVQRNKCENKEERNARNNIDLRVCLVNYFGKYFRWFILHQSLGLSHVQNESREIIDLVLQRLNGIQLYNISEVWSYKEFDNKPLNFHLLLILKAWIVIISFIERNRPLISRVHKSRVICVNILEVNSAIISSLSIIVFYQTKTSIYIFASFNIKFTIKSSNIYCWIIKRVCQDNLLNCIKIVRTTEWISNCIRPRNVRDVNLCLNK